MSHKPLEIERLRNQIWQGYEPVVFDEFGRPNSPPKVKMTLDNSPGEN